MIETYFIITFIGVVCIFLTRNKFGRIILGAIIALVLFGRTEKDDQDQVKEKEREGKVQIYQNDSYEYVTLDEYKAILKKEGEEHYRMWAAEHPEEAEKERIRDSFSRANHGYGIRSFYDPK